jgi:hypothetical protein
MRGERASRRLAPPNGRHAQIHGKSSFPDCQPVTYTEKLRAGAMSDGREEREERKARIEEERRENREDQVRDDCADDWEPEPVDS